MPTEILLFPELHALTLAARSHALLLPDIVLLCTDGIEYPQSQQLLSATQYVLLNNLTCNYITF